jgi:leucyl/phenylalanyl-tRNA protein transferase
VAPDLITPRIMRAYAELHDAGFAHSFEVWNDDGDLVGGGYGVAVGGTFTIESQFTRDSHTSKIGFAMLNWHLAHWGFVLNDNKGPTKNCLDMGFRVIPREAFLARHARAQQLPDKTGRWEVAADAATVAAWQPRETADIAAWDDDAYAASAGRRVVNPAAAALVPAFDALDGSFSLGAVLISVF